MPFKIYVDSRFRKETGGNNSDSDFTIEIPHPIQVKGKAFVDTVLIPNTFYVIRAGENDRIHIQENNVYRICIIDPGQYGAFTLKDAVLTALQNGKTVSGDYTVSYDIPTTKLVIGTLDATAAFHVHTTAYSPNKRSLRSVWGSYFSSIELPLSIRISRRRPGT